MSFNAINQSQAEDVPTLFQGARFWLSQTIPQRSTFKELIKVRVAFILFVGLSNSKDDIETWWYRCANGR
jgi:hypothetical protein